MEWSREFPTEGLGLGMEVDETQGRQGPLKPHTLKPQLKHSVWLIRGTQHRLTHYLEQLTKEELKDFQLRLSRKEFEENFSIMTHNRLEKASGVEVASSLVDRYGDQQAWALALLLWEQMGLKQLCTEARKEVDLMSSTSCSKTSTFPGHPEKSRSTFFLKKPMESVLSWKERYINWRREKSYFTPSRKSEHLLQNFSQLLLLQKPYPRSLEALDREGWKINVAQERRHMIEIQDLFDSPVGTQREPQIVILHGAAGIGKSTLARQVRRAWEEGQLFKDCFQHVFYFQCRELAQCNRLSLDQLISKDKAAPTAPMGQIMSQPEKLLFILDGVDEPEWVLEDQNPELCVHWSQQQPVHALLGSLLGRSTLPEASLLITGRTANLQKLIPSLGKCRWVEVLGFSESGRKEYFYNYFLEEREEIRAVSLVKSNPVLLTLCLVPWVSWLVCTCLKQQMDQGKDLSLNSQTTTALCLDYLSQALPAQPPHTELMRLCSLAAEGIWHKKTLFSASDLQEQGLDDAVQTTFLKMGVLQKHPSSPLYSFTHLCLQEFFAAMFYVLTFNKERIVERLLAVYGPYELFETQTMRFLFGLLSKEGVKQIEKLFHCQLSVERSWELLWRIQSEVHLQPPYSLGFLYCLYEIQDKEFLTQAMMAFQETTVCVIMDMKDPVVQTNMKSLVVKMNMDLLMVTFCLKFCSNVKRLLVNGGGQLRPALSFTRVVPWASWTDASWQILFSTSGVIINLEELDLSGNPLNYVVMRMLCRTLTHPGCCLKILRLVNCGLTSECSEYLALVLNTSTSLTELDLRMNDLDDDDVRLLCKSLRHPTCCLRLLWLDQDELSKHVRMELRALQSKNLHLLISTTGNPLVISPTQELVGEESGSSLEKIKVQSGTGSPPVAQMESLHLSPASVELMHTETLGTEDGFQGSTGPVATEVVDNERNLYRVHFPMADFYHWPNTGLRFVVRRAVTIEIEFCAWCQFLSKTPLEHSHTVAGPLFDIRAEEGAVAVVHLPHFVALQEWIVDTSLFEVAHFKEEGIVLEKPSKVEQNYIVLENPSFSVMGVLVRKIPAARRFIPITSTTLLYHHLHDKEVIFHLYLIPNDCTIRKAIDKEEMNFQFVRIHKPPPVDPLYMGSRYIVSGCKKMEIIPEKLKLCYRSPGEAQLFSEIYIPDLGSGTKLRITDKKRQSIVWEASLKPGDLRSTSVLNFPTPKDAPVFLHFVDQFRDQLVARVTSVDTLLDKLHGKVLSEEEYEKVRVETTNPDKMRRLFSFCPSWNKDNKDLLYHALKETHSYLIIDLLEKSSRGSEGF